MAIPSVKLFLKNLYNIIIIAGFIGLLVVTAILCGLQNMCKGGIVQENNTRDSKEPVTYSGTREDWWVQALACQVE